MTAQDREYDRLAAGAVWMEDSRPVTPDDVLGRVVVKEPSYAFARCVAVNPERGECRVRLESGTCFTVPLGDVRSVA